MKGCSSGGPRYNWGVEGDCAKMIETNSEPILQKTCVIWSSRRERDISLRIYYDMRELDGCRIYTLSQIDEL